jgi:hypothetical protein
MLPAAARRARRRGSSQQLLGLVWPAFSARTFSRPAASVAPRPEISKLLVANRGEIACRVLTTGALLLAGLGWAGLGWAGLPARGEGADSSPRCIISRGLPELAVPLPPCLFACPTLAAKRLGIPTVAIFSEADRHSKVRQSRQLGGQAAGSELLHTFVHQPVPAQSCRIQYRAGASPPGLGRHSWGLGPASCGWKASPELAGASMHRMCSVTHVAGVALIQMPLLRCRFCCYSLPCLPACPPACLPACLPAARGHG